MKVYETSDIRNVALGGPRTLRKDILGSGIAVTTGATNRLTRTDEGTTITDFDEDEIARKITISSAVAAAEWNKKKINLIDTPGFNMFINDTKAAMVGRRRGPGGRGRRGRRRGPDRKSVELREEFRLPRAIIINKLDRERSSFERTLENVQSVFGRTAIPIQLPLGC